jgi:uncharacterized MAPEG superfamily protein
MELIILTTTLALIQYIYFAVSVGNARRQYGIRAPQMTGHAIFERHLRVQENTQEQLIIFIPVQFMYGWIGDNLGWYGYETAAALGVVWLIGRGLYARAYVREPLSRSVGFLMTVGPSMLMLLGCIGGVLVSLL